MRRYLEGCTLAALLQGHRVMVVKGKSKIGFRPSWKHAGGAVAVTYFLWPVVGPVLPTALTVTAVVWTITAMAIGASGAGTKTAPDSPDAEQLDGADEPEVELQEPPTDATLYALVRHVAALSDQGTAAHLDDVLAEGQRRSLFGGWEKADLKEHLGDVGAPVVEGKKLTFSGRQRVRQAVLLDGLPAADPAPVPALTREAAAGPAGWSPEPAPPAAPTVRAGATGRR